MDEEPPSVKRLIDTAKDLYRSTFPPSSTAPPPTPPSPHSSSQTSGDDDDDDDDDDLICTIAPGRVNLIGEHTDYTGGFVFPMAIDYSTVCLGTGSLSAVAASEPDSAVGRCRVISANNGTTPTAVAFESRAQGGMEPLPADGPDSWANYVVGVVAQYAEDLREAGEEGGGDGCRLSLSFRIVVSGDVPLGAGLSSSASLEVSVATFIEALVARHHRRKNDSNGTDSAAPTTPSAFTNKTKALRCQRAENTFCNSPCGIMDQYVSAAALPGAALLIDCRSLEYEAVVMGSGADGDGDGGAGSSVVFVVCNSNVAHSIGGGEYPVRVAQCGTALRNLRAAYGERVGSLRDASPSDVEALWKRSSSVGDDGGPEVMEELIYRRARHVVTENERTQLAKTALVDGNWEEFGRLMNQSHSSMKLDYEVSCPEIDVLVDLAQGFTGVYGSRLTGGGFGGCTVTLVKKSKAESLCRYLVEEYMAHMGIECTCFQTDACSGAREIML